MNNKIIEVKISDIKIGARYRKEMGDIEGLAQSIKETELLQPIGLTPDHELIFGERRLRAYRDVMKLETIPARIIDGDSVLHAQIAEDVMRKDIVFTEWLTGAGRGKCGERGVRVNTTNVESRQSDSSPSIADATGLLWSGLFYSVAG